MEKCVGQKLVLVGYCCVTKNHRFGGLKRRYLLCHSFHGSGVWAWYSWISGSYVTGNHKDGEGLGQNPRPSSVQVVGRISFIVVGGLRSPFPCWLLVRVCSYLPACGLPQSSKERRCNGSFLRFRSQSSHSADGERKLSA